MDRDIEEVDDDDIKNVEPALREMKGFTKTDSNRTNQSIRDSYSHNTRKSNPTGSNSTGSNATRSLESTTINPSTVSTVSTEASESNNHTHGFLSGAFQSLKDKIFNK